MDDLGTPNLTTLSSGVATQSNFVENLPFRVTPGLSSRPVRALIRAERGGVLAAVLMSPGRGQREEAAALRSSRSGSSGTLQQFSRYRAAQASTTAAANVITAVSASWRGTLAPSEPAR